METREPQTEQEWADYYQAHKDDPDEWGDPVPAPKRRPGRPSEGRSVAFTVRFTPEEFELIARDAELHELRYSEAIRRAVRLLSSNESADRPEPSRINSDAGR
jgi:hypothetical protein